MHTAASICIVTTESSYKRVKDIGVADTYYKVYTSVPQR